MSHNRRQPKFNHPRNMSTDSKTESEQIQWDTNMSQLSLCIVVGWNSRHVVMYSFRFFEGIHAYYRLNLYKWIGTKCDMTVYTEHRMNTSMSKLATDFIKWWLFTHRLSIVIKLLLLRKQKSIKISISSLHITERFDSPSDFMLLTVSQCLKRMRCSHLVFHSKWWMPVVKSGKIIS